jgi:hypothetical protein
LSDVLDEAPAAKLVSQLLADATWTDLAKTPGDRASFELKAANAVALWTWLYPALVSRLAASHDLADSDQTATPLDTALLIVYEIASGFALRAYDWPPEDDRTLPMPLRASVEQAVRVAGVDVWAQDLGYGLALSEPQLPAPKPGPPSGVAERAAPGDIKNAARSFQEVINTYNVVSKLYDNRDAALKAEEIRRLVGDLGSGQLLPLVFGGSDRVVPFGVERGRLGC